MTGLSVKLALSYDKTQGKDKTKNGTMYSTLEVGMYFAILMPSGLMYIDGPYGPGQAE